MAKSKKPTVETLPGSESLQDTLKEETVECVLHKYPTRFFVVEGISCNFAFSCLAFTPRALLLILVL